MNLLSFVLAFPSSVRLTAQSLFTILVFTAFVGLEVVGRWLTCDLQDVVAVFVLSGLVGLVVARHRRSPLSWVSWVLARGQRFGRRMRRWKYEHGVDFRGTPPYASRLPALAWCLLGFMVGWAALAVVVWNQYPGGWRDVGIRTTYVGYLLGMVVVWTLLTSCLLAGLFVPVELLNRRLRVLLGEQDRRATLFVATLGYLMTVIAAATFLPVLFTLIPCAFAIAIAIGNACLPSRADVAILWRAGPDRDIYSVPIHRILACGVVLIVCLFTCLILTASGNRLISTIDASDRMPITGSLGALTAWTAPGLLALLAWRTWHGRRSDPARRTPPTLHLSGPMLGLESWNVVSRSVRGWGWCVRRLAEAARKRPDDVRVKLVTPEQSQATEYFPDWPLKASIQDFDNPAIRERLIRRDEILLRRNFYRRLKRLFRLAVADRGARGGGYWFAPHWWFIDTLGREDAGRRKRTEDGSGRLRQSGPSYQAVFGQRVRQYLHQVLRSVQIDVIFIEDGVKGSAVLDIFRNILEVYDIHGGLRPVDDHSFRGIPGVRATIHELAPDKVFQSTRYKQPRFDDLSRGRVLHIFKDKGDHEDIADVPHDFSWEPAPVMFGR